MSEEEDEHEEMDNWERQQFQKAIRQRQVEAAHQEMAMQYTPQRYSTQIDSPSSITATDKPIKGPSASGEFKSARTSSTAPDLSKLTPLPSSDELQQKLRDR